MALREQHKDAASATVSAVEETENDVATVSGPVIHDKAMAKKPVQKPSVYGKAPSTSKDTTTNPYAISVPVMKNQPKVSRAKYLE